MAMMKVTVIIPVYNAERYLRDTLDSVYAQDYPDVELIAVDDASTDASSEILNEYKSAFAQRGYTYVIVRRQNNGGLCAAINEGLRLYTGEFLCFPDADDVLMPNYISGMVSTLEREPAANWARCDYVTVLASENREYTVVLPEQSVYKNDFYDFVSKFVPHNAWNMLVRSAYFKQVVGQQILDTRLTQEWSMLLPLSLHSDYARCGTALYRYHIRTGAMSSWIDSGIASVIQHIEDLHNLNMEIISSLEIDAAERDAAEHALAIYYTYLKYSKYKQNDLTEEARRELVQLSALTKGHVPSDFAQSIDHPELLARFALDSVLQMRSDGPCEMYGRCKEICADGFICIVEKRGTSLLPAVRMAFGNPRGVFEVSEIRADKWTGLDAETYNDTPGLLLIENSKTADEVARIFRGTSEDQFFDCRYVRSALRGWAYLKGWM